MKAKVLLVDDNKNFIKALKHLIISILGDRIAMIDEAFDGLHAMQQFDRNPMYDIVFLDIDMPGQNGIEVANYINRLNPYVKIVAVSWHQEIEVFTKMFAAGAQSYIVKDKLNEASIEKAFASIRGFGMS